ncbi:HdeD family acid-resistance protein [Pseudoruegeria sp. HB172150]|uniref:HdeD family acid-resistance protein n=1 Tax=Pseudoruegeria sp. HB172150 TaxID=2721164 RepID=UPI00155630B4|nr:DUF308 domain-containing protein [Pseudoruegeria sp. HB172150]
MAQDDDPRTTVSFYSNVDPEALQEAVRQGKRWFTGLGVVLLILGIIALIFPLAVGITLKVLFGWILIVAGAINLWHAFQTRTWGSTIWNAIIALISLAAGVYLAFFPMTGLIAITFVLGLTFAAQGVFECIMAFQNRKTRGWGWLLASGLASVVIGLLLLLGLPGTAQWAIGVLVGIHFVTSGLSLILLARAV